MYTTYIVRKSFCGTQYIVHELSIVIPTNTQKYDDQALYHVKSFVFKRE